MDLNMKVNFKITIYTDKEYIHGLMVELTKVNGKVIKWTVVVPSNGLMEENILEIMLKIKNTVSVNSNVNFKIMQLKIY